MTLYKRQKQILDYLSQYIQKNGFSPTLTEIADAIDEGIKPAGVAVVIQAEHLCMVMRGIKKPGSNVITSALRGTFRSKSASRAEFFSLIQGK